MNVLMRALQLLRGRRAVVTLLSLVIVAAAVAATAQPQPPPTADDDRVVATIGNRTITVGELERRMQRVPPFQLRVLGSTSEQIRSAFLDQLIDKEVLARGARVDKLDERADVQSRQRAVLRSAMLAHVRSDVGDGSDISRDEIEDYYEGHKSSYRSEKLLKLWQIVVPSREQAEAVLKIIKTDPAYQQDPVKRWAELAEEHSIDESTRRRKGSLDFVRPDGTTKRPGVKVNPTLYQAAEGVADGEVVPEPVQDGANFVIVQRRGTRSTPERTLETEAPAIRRKLVQQRYEQRVEALKKELRQKHRLELYLERVDLVKVTVPEGEIQTVGRRPGGLPRAKHPSAGSPRPRGRPGHMR